MTMHRMSARRACTRVGVAACLVSVVTLLATAGGTSAQDGQGKYITEATVSLIKLVDGANRDGYVLQDNSFSIGGGWLKQSQTTWVPLYTMPLVANKDYRFLAAGDHDTRDLDLQVVDPNGKVVAADEGTDPQAIVNYRPTVSGRYTVNLRLYASEQNLPCVCLGVVTMKK